MIGWQLIYDNSPRKVYRSFEGSEEVYEQNILGGEAAMWTEQVQGVAVEGKLWPRVAALGERLWADPESGRYYRNHNAIQFLLSLKLQIKNLF